MMNSSETPIDEGYQLLACQYLREQLDRVAQYTQGARQAKDIEDVHQSRVASRRMRAALVMFSPCFPKKKIKLWTKHIKAITGGLGDARDKDVQILFVQDFLKQLGEEDKRYRTGIQRLHLRLCQQRTKFQPRVIKAIDKLDHSQALGDMAGDLERMLFVLRARQVSVATPAVWTRTAGYIQSRLTALLACQDCLTDSARVTDHHRMRIMAKKLRYTMEICRAAYGSDLNDAIKSVKQVQTLLGDIHDCDVWAEQIDQFIDREYQRTLEYFGHNRPFNFIQPGLDYLKQRRLSQRQDLFAQLQQTWNQFEQQGVWSSITTLLQQYCNQSAQSQPCDDLEVQDEQDEQNQSPQPDSDADRPAG